MVRRDARAKGRVRGPGPADGRAPGQRRLRDPPAAGSVRRSTEWLRALVPGRGRRRDVRRLVRAGRRVHPRSPEDVLGLRRRAEGPRRLPDPAVGRAFDEGEVRGILPAMGEMPRTWPADTLARVPFWVYQDEANYRAELRRIFEGPTWSFVCLESDVAKPGEFRTTFVGEMPVIVVRGQDGGVHAFENRCAHRGALIALDDAGSGR